MMSLGGYSVSFPVLPLMLSHYVHVWNSLAGFKIARAPELLEHLKMGDFKVSCVQSEHVAPDFRGGLPWRWKKAGRKRRSRHSMPLSILHSTAAQACTRTRGWADEKKP